MWFSKPTLGAVATLALSFAAGADEVETYRVTGLVAPVEILVDRWGVPHIYAANEDDLFLAQGWNAARDRLWQLDLWKRRGDGTLSEAFGPEYVAKDRAARLLLYRGDLRDEWIAYAGDTKRIVSSFVAGINAYVALTEERSDLLPPEFRALDYRPARWTPETVVEIRSHGLLRNAKAELKRALFLRRFGARALALRDHYEPAHELRVPEGLDLTVFDEQTLADYDLGTAAVSFAALLGETPALSGSFAAPTQTPRERPRADESAASAGSNNWAIAASRTTTGRPILANDPHRALELPSLRYLVHLSSPRLELIGGGEPALPGVSLGHNGHIAFGFTIFGMDQEDLYVLDTRGSEGDTPEYRVADGWERMTEVREHISVRDDPAGRDAVLRFTRHGPVLAEDPARGVAIALRAAWLEPGMAPYLASLELQRVRDWDGFLAALNRWGLPGENLVYADTSGAIGWKPAGRIPVRPGWDGLLPVPGGGRYEWAGYLDGDALPVERNPARGWVASANQMNLPQGYQHAVGYEWAPPYRYERIAEALSERERWSVEDVARLQTDYVSTPARWLVERLKTIDGRSDVERRALALLRDWDCRLDAGSPAAALFEVWLRRHLPAAVWARVARAQALDADAAKELESATVPALLTVLEEGGSARGASSRGALSPEEVTAALLESLGAAVADVEERLGADWRAWRWGALHHARFDHPLAAPLRAKLGIETAIEPSPRSGSGDTPGATTYEPPDFRQRSGASVRVVIDVGSWDGSVAMNTPGQSGLPGS
ncbi:MAG TPA: penicillin acylase family protein, partial [Thermoanaerobaculia bacterium]|nr:penicillin acylase family protein [Thermoanaerobaculia bacterium]